MASTLEKRIAAARREIRAKSMDGIQRRTYLQQIELRDDQTGDGGGYAITGHGWVYNSLSDDLGGFKEKIAPGAADHVLASAPDVRQLFNHDPNLILSATRNGTLAISSDAVGGNYRGDVTPAIAQTYYGQAMRAQLSEGLVSQSSFAFRVASDGDEWVEDPDTGGLIRTIHQFSGLYDVSPVTYPAYPAADSSLYGRSTPSLVEIRSALEAAGIETRVDVNSVNAVSMMLFYATEFMKGEVDDSSAIAAMQSVVQALTLILDTESAEQSSSPSFEQREADGRESTERSGTGSSDNGQADNANHVEVVRDWMAEQMRLGRA